MKIWMSVKFLNWDKTEIWCCVLSDNDAMVSVLNSMWSYKKHSQNYMTCWHHYPFLVVLPNSQTPLPMIPSHPLCQLMDPMLRHMTSHQPHWIWISLVNVCLLMAWPFARLVLLLLSVNNVCPGLVPLCLSWQHTAEKLVQGFITCRY